ncbi:MAG TPA: transcriptional regulator [Polyangiaceae bacterium]
MLGPRYNSFADFERELIRPSLRAGWSADELEESNVDCLDFDLDPFEAALRAAESDD